MKIEAAQRQLVSLALAVAFAAAVLLPSAGQGETPAAASSTGTETPVVVFAAASLKTALDAVAAAWKINTGKTASIAYASSGTLAKQIEQGAPADIFISADLNGWILSKRPSSSAPKRAGDFLATSLSSSNQAMPIPSLRSSRASISRRPRAMAKSRSAPWTWAQVEFTRRKPSNSLGIFASVEPKLAQIDTIRNALSLVSRGEAKFGIVFATDAKADPKVKVVGTFPGVIESGLFLLTSQAATKIFRGQGFDILPK